MTARFLLAGACDSYVSCLHCVACVAVDGNPALAGLIGLIAHNPCFLWRYATWCSRQIHIGDCCRATTTRACRNRLLKIHICTTTFHVTSDQKVQQLSRNVTNFSKKSPTHRKFSLVTQKQVTLFYLLYLVILDISGLLKHREINPMSL